MTNERYQEAFDAASTLVEFSDDRLLEELGLRILDAQNIGGYERLLHYDGSYSHVADDMLSIDDLKEVGKRWWKRLEPELMQLVCDPKNEEMGKITGGKAIPEIAASLATAGVLATFAPPAWVIVATTILAVKITETGLDSLCEVWGESLAS